MHPHDLLLGAATRLFGELGKGYLVSFSCGGQTHAGVMSADMTLCVYVDGPKLTALIQCFSDGNGGQLEQAARMIQRVDQWLAVGRSLGAKEAA